MRLIRVETTYCCIFAACTIVLSSSTSLQANVRLPSFFSDHMAVQQEIPVTIWGWADPGEEVTVELAGRSTTVPANTQGKWRVQLGALKAGGPHTMTLQGKNREGQLLAMRTVPNTGMAVAIDVGDSDGPRPSHPPDKNSVGERLARWALNRVYGQTDLIPSGPVYKSHEVLGSEMVIHLDYVGGGLVARGEQAVLRGFTVAGEDRKWHWADARIEGNTVVVSAPKVRYPVAVRYAWANIPNQRREG